MLKQLDLFGAPMDEPSKPSPARKRLTPPQVVELEPAADAGEEAAAVEAPAVVPEVKDLPIAEETIDVPREEVEIQAAAEPTIPTEAAQHETAVAAEPADDLPRKSTRGRKSLKEMGRDAALVELPDDTQLYSKQYYGIGEVAAMFNVNASLLRFWEAEFDIIKPRKNKKGDRFFRPEDIKNLQLIHHLLRERKYTIDGAREFLRKSGKRKEQFEAIESLKKIRAFLLEMKAGL